MQRFAYGGHSWETLMKKQRPKATDLSTACPEVGPSALSGREEMLMTMRLALAVSVFLIAAAPFVGRWRANVWLKKHMQDETTVETGTAAKPA